MAFVEINPETNVIELQSDFRDKELCKAVPGGTWNDEIKRWVYPLGWATCLQLRSVFGQRLQVGQALAAWARDQRDNRVQPCLELRTASDSPGLAEDWPQLRPFQRAGVEFLATAKQALIADEMGTGKTVQSIATLETLSKRAYLGLGQMNEALQNIVAHDAYPALVIAPNSMRTTWKREFEKWAPGRKVVAVGDDQVQGVRKMKKATPAQTIQKVIDGEADVLVINWEAIRLYSRCAGWFGQELTEKEKTPGPLNDIEWKTVVADEAHKAKDPKSQQTRALWYLGRNAEYRFCLTGTPVANSPEDMWALMRFVSPDEFPAKTKFLDRYAQVSDNGWGGREIKGIKAESKDELFSILDPRFIRRTKAAVLPELPAKQYTTRYIEMTGSQAKAYKQMEDRMMAELEGEELEAVLEGLEPLSSAEVDGGVVIAPTALAQMTRLIQFASASGEIAEDGELRLTDPSNKVDALMEIAAELGGSRAAVFSESKQLINIAKARLEREGYKVGLVTGDVVGAARQRFVDDFNEGRIQFILVTLGAGGEGLSLTGSSTAIFLQRSFSATKNAQGEDRLHGIGRGEEGKALNIIDIITPNSIEARVWEIMAEKQRKLQEIVRDGETEEVWAAK